MLREMILEGALPGGEKIREKDLTVRFGVSRTPLREAMKVLAAEGLIELIPNRGAIVSRHSVEDLADVFPVLASLERLAGELAAVRATDAEIERICTLTANLGQTVEGANRPQYFKINQAIHDAILAASGNETLIRTHATIAGRVHRARYQANLTKSRWERALEEHGRIADALKKRDGARLGALLNEHMLAKLSSILDALQAGETGT
ncbi:MAG: GntR family transcriptional regulator [Roseibium sp.]|nr:GntR family transcriptional regulator [Roseibium sp.]